MGWKVTMVWLLAVLAASPCLGQGAIPFALRNPLPEPRTDEVVVITRRQYLDRAGYVPSHLVPQAYDSAGTPIPTQADDLNGDDIWDEAAMLVTLGPNQKARYTVRLISPDVAPQFPTARRVWLAPYIVPNDSNRLDTVPGFRYVDWGKIQFDSTRSVFAQYLMGGFAIETDTQAVVMQANGFFTGYSKPIWANSVIMGPPYRFKANQTMRIDRHSQSRDPAEKMRGAQVWIPVIGPVRSIAFIRIPAEKGSPCMAMEANRQTANQWEASDNRSHYAWPQEEKFKDKAIRLIGF